MYDAAVGRFTGVDPIADRFAWVSTYNYAENELVANIDLHGLQRYKPDMKEIEKPSDLISSKMLHNLKEGVKTVLIEFKETVGSLIQETLPEQGHPEPEEFHDSGDKVPGGTEVMTGNDELNSSGTSETADSENGAKEIVDEVLAPGGSMMNKAASKSSQVSKAMDNLGRALDNAQKVKGKANSGERDTIKNEKGRYYNLLITKPKKENE